MKGKLVLISVSILILVAVGGSFLMFTQKTDTPITAIMERALTIDERAQGVIPSQIQITNETERFVRGTIIDDRDGLEKTFFAIKIGDAWRIVDVTTSNVSCERFARLGFPSALISDCELSFRDAVTVAEIDATFAGFSLEGAELQVIGFVTDVQTDASGTMATIESGDATTVVTITDTPVTVGDLLVVTLADVADATKKADASTGTTGGSETTGVYTVVKTVSVGSQDTDLGVPKETPSTLPQEKKDTLPKPTVTGDNGTTVYKINAPKTAPPQSYFFNEYDLDASFEDIQIDGSF